ncbi:hypothetical protein C3747_64g1172c [Trypanosoma cruzi]|uniref:Calpain-like cysteine peptidase, putative n=2 Tax=Trypanosoma cruzi TaxID=5693 RepID=Q4CW63_TRYCC|nr:calpain-like cysteine peptidase, putative [Trypanosoma cruzi]PBJ72384.1 calpain-like cysteine peptidase [Trypanosoma cruzi cruzi]EAN84515.1 calpain-like cysteine peptidase, putative [Trypanosoma cruzi]KAF8277079.1 small myristoylated protein 1-2 [Trypanosoma cruzi]KAF8285543.1 small myristoylated protein 1-2 [Trypanosoma cruzi]KAF8286425.1 small myristoylated protein 1-2 [Trypanosoma cruzi]|eukprot:XP_806366.1 calpain-like cysteine peptidase [Trypanosoma cruzi strain CL Brener]
MGCGASSRPYVDYRNGKPNFKGDEIVRGFDEGNGLLFRIVNNKKRRWAYYNDTTEYEMHVKVTFSEDCNVRALGRTHLQKLESGEYLATIVVHPCETEMFIEGRVNGFQAKMDAVPTDRYKHRRRRRKGGCCS